MFMAMILPFWDLIRIGLREATENFSFLIRADDFIFEFVQLNPSDVNAWIRLAQTCQLSDFQCGLNAYRKAVDLMKDSNMKIPFEIFNNIAALHYELGDNQNALKWCEELIQSFVEEE